MSLLVNVYTRDQVGSMVFVDPTDHSETLAGFESWRQEVYGSQAARSLGLHLLPTLDGSDIYAEGEDIDRLRAEVELALANLKLFETESGANFETLRVRFENIIAATRRAAAAKGGVVVW